jgi:long-chain acyl-CoA synthetase
MGLFTGGSVAIHPAWGAAEWARLVEETGATISGLVPAMMVDVLGSEEARGYDTSSLRMCFYGGSPAAESTLEEFEAAFDVDSLLNYYGQTEATGVTVAGTPETPRTEGALGEPVPTVEASVFDPDTGDPVGDGADGELWLRGDSVMPRYWEAPDLTEEAFEGTPASEASRESEALRSSGRWFRTGDVVRREKGVLYFVDRLDDIVLSGGEKVAPSRVESVLVEMDGVRSYRRLRHASRPARRGGHGSDRRRRFACGRGGRGLLRGPRRAGELREAAANPLRGLISADRQPEGGQGRAGG